MERTLKDHPAESESLPDAIRAAARAWAVGYFVATKEPEYEQPPMPSEDDFRATLAQAKERDTFEAAVLDRTMRGRSKYRALTEEDLAPLDELVAQGEDD